MSSYLPFIVELHRAMLTFCLFVNMADDVAVLFESILLDLSMDKTDRWFCAYVQCEQLEHNVLQGAKKAIKSEC